MRLAQDDEMVHALAPDGSDQPFGKAVLPRRGSCSRFVPDAHGAQSSCDDSAVDPIPIPDEILRGIIPRKRLGYLTRNPLCLGVCCDIDPDQRSAVEPNDDEGIEQIEADGRDNEQVHGGNVRCVVTQKGAPTLAWQAVSLDHVLGDARLRDLKPELEQFSVDARRAPERVIDAHPPDQRAEVRLDLRPPSPCARLPTPVAAEARPMPTHERLGLDDRENLQGRRKPSIQLDKEPAITVREPDPATHLTPQNN